MAKRKSLFLSGRRSKSLLGMVLDLNKKNQQRNAPHASFGGPGTGPLPPKKHKKSSWLDWL